MLSSDASLHSTQKPYAADVSGSHCAQQPLGKHQPVGPPTFPQGRVRTTSAERPLPAPRLHNRAEAGRKLAERLNYYANSDAVVVAVANGAVPIAFELAATLSLQLRYLAFKTITCPEHHPELAVGAVSEPGGETVRNQELLDSLKVTDDQFRFLCDKQRALLINTGSYSSNMALQSGEISGKTAIVIMDVDEVNKVALVRLVIRLLRAKCPNAPPKSLVIASPAISPDTAKMVKPHTGHVEGYVFDGYIEWICIEERNVPEKLDDCYEYCSPVSDDEVSEILNKIHAH